MSSKNQYDTNVWHTVVFTRQQSKGTLIINADDEAFGESIGNTRSMNVQAPYSFGGVNPKTLEDLQLNLELEKGKFFSGCIRNIQVGARSLGQPSQVVGVLPCSEQVETGVFFGKSGGYVKV